MSREDDNYFLFIFLPFYRHFQPILAWFIQGLQHNEEPLFKSGLMRCPLSDRPLETRMFVHGDGGEGVVLVSVSIHAAVLLG